MAETTAETVLETGDSGVSGPGGILDTIQANKIVVAMVVVLFIIIIACVLLKEPYRNKPIRDDDQSDFSVREVAKDFVNYQESLLRKIKMSEAAIDEEIGI